MKTDLLGLDSKKMEDWVVSQGLEPYRGRQIRHWLLGRYTRSFDEMYNLPKTLRNLLKEQAFINQLNEIKVLKSVDGTRKYLFGLSDNQQIESVLIPEKDHFTICISSQVGCAMGCAFCLTAKQGFKRNLTASEIIAQVIHVKSSMHNPERLTNIVLMGMGEPLANYESVLKAMENITGQDGMNFSHKKVTLSTCGLVPEINALGKDITVNLAVSLNAPDNETRNLLMPINKKYPLKKLLAACKEFPLPNRRMLTFEYILINGINDHPDHALKLCSILSDIRCKINLIPFNSYSGTKLTPSSPEKRLRFQEILVQNHFTAIIRKSKGQDILAACGQLRGSHQEGKQGST